MTQSWQGRSDGGPKPRLPTAVVVAHPDDEVLWLSSIVASADRVVLCFGDVFGRPDISDARRRAVAALPLTGLIDLAIPESGSGYTIDRIAPEPTPTGIRIEDAAARERYASNYAQLIDRLRSALAGCGDVYTHNPWGEYGHPEHIQVHRAAAALRDELGFTIWFTNYVGPVSWTLARRLGGEVSWTQRRTVRADRAAAHRLMRIYRRYDAWTWNRGHHWPALETMYAQPPTADPAPRYPLSGEWLLDATRLRRWSPSWRFARRRLPLLPQGLRSHGDVHTPPLAR